MWRVGIKRHIFKVKCPYLSVPVGRILALFLKDEFHMKLAW